MVSLFVMFKWFEVGIAHDISWAWLAVLVLLEIVGRLILAFKND